MNMNDKKYEKFRQREKRKKLNNLFQNLLLTFFVALFGFPIYWIFIGAFKEKGEFFIFLLFFGLIILVLKTLPVLFLWEVLKE